MVVGEINIFILILDSRAGIVGTMLHKHGSVEPQGSSLQSRFQRKTKQLYGNYLQIHQSYLSECLQLCTRFSCEQEEYQAWLKRRSRKKNQEGLPWK